MARGLGRDRGAAVQHDDTGAATRRRTLPPAALADLREAYAEEVGERLPRLLAAAASGSTGPDVVRDAHSLGSSSFVVDEPEAGLLARDVEARLLDGRPFAEQVDLLAAVLDHRPVRRSA
ncbi:MAG: hypothetical protein JWM64_1780 [Frankiales bacterium]|nr:hypothetical protein [Frankiales bacterium]